MTEISGTRIFSTRPYSWTVLHRTYHEHIFHIQHQGLLFNSGRCSQPKYHFMYNLGTAKLQEIYIKDTTAEKVNICSFFFRSFLLHCFPLSTSVKQSFGSSCDLLNRPFHQNEIVKRATWRRSKIAVLDENRDASCISLAVTKHYKVIHLPLVIKKKKPKTKTNNAQLFFNDTSIQLVPEHQSKIMPLALP